MTGVAHRDRVLAALLKGLPWSDRPYADLAHQIGLSESEVLEIAQRLRHEGVLSRLGFVVRHHEAGYRANALVVWSLPDSEADRCGAILAQLPWVTLAYRRRATPPHWPYNLYAMIHGTDRAEVLEQVKRTIDQAGLGGVSYKVLFSTRRFVQRSGAYVALPDAVAA